MPLKLAQTAALLEIVHSAVGLVRSPVLITLTQVASRIWILWGIIDVAPDPKLRALVLLDVAHMRISLSLVTLMTAWCVTEIIRYGFYAFKEFGLQPYFLLWLRYTLFIVLYPLGVSSELAMVVLANSYLRKNAIWSLRMPNTLNFGFDYWLACWVIVMFYLPGLPALYGYMLTQRRKVLGTGKKRKQT